MSAVPSHSLSLPTMLALMMVMVLALMVVFMIGQVRFLVIFYRARDWNVGASPRYFAGYPDSPHVR